MSRIVEINRPVVLVYNLKGEVDEKETKNQNLARALEYHTESTKDRDFFVGLIETAFAETKCSMLARAHLDTLVLGRAGITSDNAASVQEKYEAARRSRCVGTASGISLATPEQVAEMAAKRELSAAKRSATVQAKKEQAQS
jgi:hypothetical protein